MLVMMLNFIKTFEAKYDIDKMIFSSFPNVENESNLEYLERQLKCVNNDDLVFYDVKKNGVPENLDKNVPYVLLYTENDSQCIKVAWQGESKNINIDNVFKIINKSRSTKIIIDDLKSIFCKDYLSFHLNKKYPVSLLNRVQVMDKILTTSIYYSDESWKLRDDTTEEYSEIFRYSKRYIYVSNFNRALKDIYTDFQVAKVNQDTIMLADLVNIVRKIESLWLLMSLEPILIDIVPISKDDSPEVKHDSSSNKLWMLYYKNKWDNAVIKIAGFYYKSIFINTMSVSCIDKLPINNEGKMSILESLDMYFKNIGIKVFDISQKELFEKEKELYELKNSNFNNEIKELQKVSFKVRGATSTGLTLFGLFFLSKAISDILHYTGIINFPQIGNFISGLTNYASTLIRQSLQNQPEKKLFDYPVRAAIFAGLGATCLFFNRPTHAAKVTGDFVDNILREQKSRNISS